jgi:hypothetical protein
MTFRLYNSNKDFPDLTPVGFSASRVENRHLVLIQSGYYRRRVDDASK